MITPAELDASLHDLADRARRLRALSRVNPHQFLEDKQELADAIDQLRGRVACAPSRSRPDFSGGGDGNDAAKAGKTVGTERHGAINGPRGPFRTGRIVVPSKRHMGREVRVETRRAA